MQHSKNLFRLRLLFFRFHILDFYIPLYPIYIFQELYLLYLQIENLLQDDPVKHLWFSLKEFLSRISKKIFVIVNYCSLTFNL